MAGGVVIGKPDSIVCEPVNIRRLVKAAPVLPRMGENRHAPIKKGIENTVEHGSYQCLMTPTGLEDGVQTPENTNALVESDAKSDATYADLLEILTRWPTLPAQVRAEVMALICSD